jgi:nitrite reductase (NO-forming)
MSKNGIENESGATLIESQIEQYPLENFSQREERELLEEEAKMIAQIAPELSAEDKEEEIRAFHESREQTNEAQHILEDIQKGKSSEGMSAFMENHPRFANLSRAFLLVSSLTGAFMAGKGLKNDSEYIPEPVQVERALSKNEIPKPAPMLEKSKMEVVEGIEGVVWTHAPEVPPMPDLEAPPRIVDVHWNIVEKPGEIAPGETYTDRWTIEGSVPGPMLRLVEGDVLRISLTNNGAMPHNLDFHAITGPGGGGHDLMVNAGETATIEARMLTPGLFQVHCAPAKFGAAMIAMHVANGMSGFIMVQPRDNEAVVNQPVDKEWMIVQNEWYAKPTNEPGKVSFDMDAGMLRHPSHIVFNGSTDALTGKNALQAKTGDKIRLYIGDSGPNFPSNFHAIGEIFDNVYDEGDVISEPGHGKQTTLVPPGGSTIVEFKTEVPGEITLVTHDLFSLVQGAVGKINVSGDENPEVYQVIKKGAPAETK